MSKLPHRTPCSFQELVLAGHLRSEFNNSYLDWTVVTFSKIIIGNRAEIACRVIRIARRLGIATAVDVVDTASSLTTSLLWPYLRNRLGSDCFASKFACRNPWSAPPTPTAADGALRGMIERRDRKGSGAGRLPAKKPAQALPLRGSSSSRPVALPAQILY
jgi:hypothetical protein